MNTTGGISDLYSLEITPAGWTLIIWGFIYAYQTIFILYVLFSICRRNKDGYVFKNPVTITPFMLLLYILNLSLNITWLFLFDREQMIAAVIVIAFLPATLWIMLFINHRLVQQNIEDFETNKR